MKFIIWTILIILILRWLFKPFLKVVIFHSAKTMAENMQKQQYQQQKPRYPEGSIHIDNTPSGKNPKKGSNNPAGDYVDYEEIK
jgi:hypothetical protein